MYSKMTSSLARSVAEALLLLVASKTVRSCSSLRSLFYLTSHTALVVLRGDSLFKLFCSLHPHVPLVAPSVSRALPVGGRVTWAPGSSCLAVLVAVVVLRRHAAELCFV